VARRLQKPRQWRLRHSKRLRRAHHPNRPAYPPTPVASHAAGRPGNPAPPLPEPIRPLRPRQVVRPSAELRQSRFTRPLRPRPLVRPSAYPGQSRFTRRLRPRPVTRPPADLRQSRLTRPLRPRPEWTHRRPGQSRFEPASPLAGLIWYHHLPTQLGGPHYSVSPPGRISTPHSRNKVSPPPEIPGPSGPLTPRYPERQTRHPQPDDVLPEVTRCLRRPKGHSHP
jgi:hypothetical protein